MSRPLRTALLGILSAGVVCAAVGYSRYVDWPSLGGWAQVRAYLPEAYPLQEAHYYRYRNFMDTWDLYRFLTSLDGIEHIVHELRLTSAGPVYEFPLIVSRPPPYWWHPELVPVAELFRSQERAPDGRNYDLLYSEDTGMTYMIRFDG